MVEEGNLFDPARPSLGSELEALRQHLEALRSGPDTWESHLDRPTGMPWAAWAVPMLGGLRPQLWCQLGQTPAWSLLAVGPPSEPLLCVPGAHVPRRTQPGCPPWWLSLVWAPQLGICSGCLDPGLSWPSVPSFCLSSVLLLSGLGGQGPAGALAFPGAESVAT